MNQSLPAHAGNGPQTLPTEPAWIAAVHDLRQPLQTAQLYAGLLADAARADDRQRLAGQLEGALLDLSAMMDQLTLLMRFESGDLTAAPRPMPLAELIAAIETDAVTLAGAGQLAMARGEHADAAVNVAMDRRLLSLLTRAVAATSLSLVNASAGQVAAPVVRRMRDGKPSREVAVIAFSTASPAPGTIEGQAMFIELRGDAGAGTRSMMAPGPGVAARIARLLDGRFWTDADAPGNAEIALHLPIVRGDRRGEP